MNFLNFDDEYLDNWVNNTSSTDSYKDHFSDYDLATKIDWEKLKEAVDKLFEE